MEEKENNKNLKKKTEIKSKEKNLPIWVKLSSSIAYYLRTCDLDSSNEKLLDDYLDFAYSDSEIEGNITYLNKQTKEWVEIDKTLQDRIKTTFIERIEMMREKYEEEKKVYTNNVIEFRKRN